MNSAILTPQKGEITMSVILPPGFKYKKAFLAGRPQHKPFDGFYHLHPPMDRIRRAKIFAPFDALDGYAESIDGVNVEYVEKIEISETEKSELNRRFNILRSLTANGTQARKNHIEVNVTYYKSCSNRNRFDWHFIGQYLTESGVCRKVDPEIDGIIQVGEKIIPLDDVIAVTSPNEALFTDDFPAGDTSFFEVQTSGKALPGPDSDVNPHSDDRFSAESEDCEWCDDYSNDWLE